MDTQNRDSGMYRQLSPGERDQLTATGNRVEDWNSFLVADPFFPDLIRNSSFSGEVRIKSIQPEKRNHAGKTLKTGIYNSEVSDCHIGEQTVIRNVAYCSNYSIGRGCILSDIQELYTRPGAQFGCGILYPGEEESSRRRIALINEAGNRRVPTFPGMTAGDAFLWARYREDSELMHRLEEITDRSFCRLSRGVIGEGSVIQGCRSLIDLRTGPFCRIEGSDLLESISMDSSEDEPTCIGYGVLLRRGIIGPGCRVLDGAMAENFALASHVTLTKGLRLSDSFVGDNSNLACCEVSNSLIYPFHEQHHNNSFLIAALVMGQSNLAAGATIGSNHNSRGADSELHAGRGFWPGLNVSLKHPSRFASFTLIAKGSYPSELDIPLPFSLVNNNEHDGCLDIIPAFWWNYNMYALARNSWKFLDRDRRKNPLQEIEFDFLAPDTADEIAAALELLDQWDPTGSAESIQIPPGLLEHSSRRVRILKADKARRAYREMLEFYSLRTLFEWFESDPGNDWTILMQPSGEPDPEGWINYGGQIVTKRELRQLIDDIRTGSISSWEEIHSRYRQWTGTLPFQKARQAYRLYQELRQGGNKAPGDREWKQSLKQLKKLQRELCERVYSSRKKDEENTFRAGMYRNREEMKAVAGSLEENGFLLQIRRETDNLIARIDRHSTLRR
jgi:NDP-sugar pyrophosphorylase family protein